MPKYKLIHLFFIAAFILFSGFIVLWLFHYTIPNPFPNTEFYLILVIYLTAISVTAYVFKENNLIQIHRHIGFRLISFRTILLTIALALVIWIADYFYQIHILNTNIAAEAQSWFQKNQQSNLLTIYLSTGLFAPIVEEILFRGIFLKTLNNYLNKHWSALILASVFTAIHFSIPQAPTLFLASLIYIYLTYKSNSIVPAIIAHMINNSITFIYYVVSANKIDILLSTA
jgi:membrane protease YdiL (CAAX protease family)